MPDAPGFETWVITEREWFHQLMLAGLQQLLTADRAAGRDYDAINVARRMLQVAPWHEEAHQELMALLARTGQRSAALAQFELCRRLLDEELGVPPSAKTEALRAQIAVGAMRGDDQRSDGGAVTLLPIAPNLAEPEQVRNAPNYPDLLLGRAEDITRVRALLDDPACRLLTLVGPGGIGKTRLALAATDGNVAQYAQGACFIPFAGLTPAKAENCTDLVINGIANVLGYTFDAQQDPHTILLNYLANKHLLLICDNFEHLQPAATLLEEIVLAAPGVQLVVTSRKRLGVKHEWLYDVAGLAYATDGESAVGQCTYPASALFARCAQQVKVDFDPVAEADHIHAICRVLEGWPLSIELAANWLRLLSCAAIAARLQDDVMLLDAATTAPDDRHRSMRAVLEASWALLTSDEQRVCGGVSCFRGGFELNAAQAVVHAGLVQLGSLVDKSFLRCDASGRYAMHEQVRQFAAARLGDDAVALDTIHRRHSTYFVALAAAQPILPGGTPGEATVTLFDRELKNLRLALAHALTDNDTARVASLLESLWPYYRFKGWNREIIVMMQQACDLQHVPLAQLARWQRWWADALYHVGELRACNQKVEELMCMLGKPLPSTVCEQRWFLLRAFGRQLLHRTFPRIAFGHAAAQRAVLVETVRAMERYGQAGMFLGQPMAFLVGITAVNHAERAGATELLAAGYAALSLLLSNLACHWAAAYYHRLALRYVDHDTNVAHRAYALEVISFNLFMNGDWQAAREVISKAVTQAEQAARRRSSLELQLLVAISYGFAGDYEAALAQAGAVLPRARELGDVVVQAWSLIAQAEFCLHADREPTTRALPLLQQAQALPPNRLNKSEHFGIHGNLAVVALRTGDNACAAHELDLALATVNSMVFPANGAFESYADLPEVALALAERASRSAPGKQLLEQRAAHACAILENFARAHRFARPRALIYAGIYHWQHGRQRKAFSLWQQSAAVAAAAGMNYDLGRAHFEIGRRLAAHAQIGGLSAAQHLERAHSVFQAIGAGYMLSQLEAMRR